MKKIFILIGYARSGITVFNRCLASDKRLICLSEINSRFQCPTFLNTPHDQLKNWYGIKIKRSTTLTEIEYIKKYADKKDKILVIRDWSFGSFVPLKYNNFTPPQILNTIDDFTIQHETVPFCMVRNPIDVWLSMRDSPKTFHDKNLDYLYLFTKDVMKRQIPIFKYEDFCDNPINILEKVYESIGLHSINKIKFSNNVTGDVHTSSSRGKNLNSVIKLTHRNLSIEDKNYLLSKTKIKEIMNMLNYSDTRLD